MTFLIRFLWVHPWITLVSVHTWRRNELNYFSLVTAHSDLNRLMSVAPNKKSGIKVVLVVKPVSLSSCPMCLAGPWGSQAQKEYENRLLHSSGLHQAAPLSHTGPNLWGAAAGLQSPVQFLPEEHSVPGLYIQQTSHSKQETEFWDSWLLITIQKSVTFIVCVFNLKPWFSVLKETGWHTQALSLQTDNLCFMYCL